MQTSEFKPGARVVSQRRGYGAYQFGTIVGDGADAPGGGAVRPYLAVQWDDEEATDRYVWPDNIALLPPAWQPKAARSYRVTGGDDEDAVIRFSTDHATLDQAKAAAEARANEDRGCPIVVCAIVPLVEIIAPPLVAPPVEVREL